VDSIKYYAEVGKHENLQRILTGSRRKSGVLGIKIVKLENEKLGKVDVEKFSGKCKKL